VLPEVAPLMGDSRTPWQANPALSHAPTTRSMTCRVWEWVGVGVGVGDVAGLWAEGRPFNCSQCTLQGRNET